MRRLAVLLLLAVACSPPSRGREEDDDTNAPDASGTPIGGDETPDAGSSVNTGNPDGGFGSDGGAGPDGGWSADAGGGADGGSGPDAGGAFDGGSGFDAGTVTTPDYGTVAGSVAGRTLTPADAIAHGSTSSLVIELLDRPATCAIVQSGAFTASVTSLAFVVNRSGGVVPGSYSLGGPLSPGFFTVADAQCQSTVSQTATSGSVTLTSVGFATGALTEGSFNIWFGSDHVTGTFRATACDPFPADRTDCR